MTSVVVAVGCDRYDAISPLRGAEKDATDVFNTLCSVGDLYCRERSRLLSSPSLSDFQLAIREIQASGEEVDVLTFYFAAHGGEKNGNYYICLRDSDPAHLSMSGLPISLLSALINEMSPRQVNVVLDCCQSGSAMYELGPMLRSIEADISAAASVAFLAATRADENAFESHLGGVATRALLDVISGATTVQDSRPYLDLIEVGRAVSSRIGGSGALQTPIAWGINLYGEGRFAANPHHRFPGEMPQFAVPGVARNSEFGARIRDNSSDLWEEYRKFRDDPDPVRLHAVLSKVVAGTSETDLGAFVTGFARALADRCGESFDVLSESSAWGVLAVETMRITGAPGVAARREMLSELAAANERGCEALLASLTADPRCLLGSHRGLSNFYYLPLRISRLLGWAGSSLLASSLVGEGDRTVPERWGRLVDTILQHYAGSLVAICDAQAPWLNLFAAACQAQGWTTRARAVFCPVFEDLVSVRGAISKWPLPAEAALEYLLHRSWGAVGPNTAIARPMQLLPVLLLHGDRLGLADEWDYELRALDRLSINLFVPATYADFRLGAIRNGQNFTNTVGEGVWSVSDYARAFRAAASSAVAQGCSNLDPTVLALAVVASEVFPDRVALFVTSPPTADVNPAC